MADLLTHYATARVAAAAVRVRPGPWLTLLGVGAILPDLVGKPLGHFPGSPDFFSLPSHSASGLLLLCSGLSLLFAPDLRGRAFVALFAGSLLHVAVDLLKDNLGYGAVTFLHPFSLESWELGFYRSEDVLILLPGNLAVLLFLWARRRQKN